MSGGDWGSAVGDGNVGDLQAAPVVSMSGAAASRHGRVQVQVGERGHSLHVLGALCTACPTFPPSHPNPPTDRVVCRQLRTLREALGVMRSSMLGVIAERRQRLAARGDAGGRRCSCGSGGAAMEAEAEAAAEDLLDMLLLATDEEGRPMTGGRVMGAVCV